LNLSGKHNVLNSLAACACGLELQISFETIAGSLKNFESVGRRLEKRGEKNGAFWIDDYGHHPTEIKAALSALKERYPDRNLVVVFQPHRYSRTKLLLKEFGGSFGDASEVVLLPIYPAGEKPMAGVGSQKLLPFLKKRGIPASFQNGKKADFSRHLNPGTIFLTLGAGDVWKVGEKTFS
jgi:UDP-N-acetylmuramate--alanine ligase